MTRAIKNLPISSRASMVTLSPVSSSDVAICFLPRKILVLWLMSKSNRLPSAVSIVICLFDTPCTVPLKVAGGSLGV